MQLKANVSSLISPSVLPLPYGRISAYHYQNTNLN
jgi:hypothetical protein